MSSRPNLVFVMSDDHAAHAIGAYGSTVNQTPQMDRLAAEGMRLDSTFCTNSICSPSRATILTGAYSHVNGVRGIFETFDYRVNTFPQVLQQAGYATALFGKWHLGVDAANHPQGFDEWLIFPDQGQYHDPEMIGPGPDGLGERTVIEGYATDIVTDLSLDWLSRVPADQPFCLLVHHKAPHRPWEPHPRHADLYPLDTIPEPDTLFDAHDGRAAAVHTARMTIADDLTVTDVKEECPPELLGEEHRVERTRWFYQRYLRDYLQCIQAVDDSVGQILDALQARGVADDTVVVYTSDQGFFLGDHGWYDKRFMADESLRMPMLLRWPAVVAPGSQLTTSVTNVDFAATFLEICGQPASALDANQGRSFLPMLRGEQPGDWDESVYYRYWEHDDPSHHVWAHYGVRTPTHKLICYYADGLGVKGASDEVYPTEWELFDLVADPAELVNVADDPAHAQVRAELTEQLARLQAQYRDEPYRPR
ncbi:sulfatase family protein [Aestuariimicrobium ganziense]|uniref:sulfatase family protein n=1 Tax=Aestuariimicrobium ganziense TaxID=2773677 RepID=UPI002E2AED44|nr:sulfatase [Aestuariimicrobium ganziense]